MPTKPTRKPNWPIDPNQQKPKTAINQNLQSNIPFSPFLTHLLFESRQPLPLVCVPGQ